MPIKVCLCSDNHGNMESINKIKEDNPCCDYYFHLGDSDFTQNELKPFLAIKGNNDWGSNLPKQKIVDIYNHRILLIHGDGYTYAINGLFIKTKRENCDVVMFGHTHEFCDEIYKDIRLINPGSCFHNRDMSNPCYALVTFYENGKIDVERINLE